MGDIKWIKITTDIFDDQKIKLIEQLPDADTIIVIWFKLLCMAGKENNCGVFVMGGKMPYTEEMLATIFGRPLNTVRLALATFEAYCMIEINDNDVISIPNWEKHQNLDYMEKVKEQNRKRVANYRERQKTKVLEVKEDTCNVTETLCNGTDKIREDKNRLDKKENKKIKDPAPQYFDSEPLNTAFLEFIKMRKQIKAPMTDKAIELAISNIKKLAVLPFSDELNEDMAIQILNNSILNGWKGLFPLKEDKQKPSGKATMDMWRDA